MNRRDVLQASALAATAALGGTGAASAQMSSQPAQRRGFALTPLADSNPLEAKIVAFNTVSPDVDASITFYRDVIGMTVVDEGTLPGDISSAPGGG